MALAKDLLDKLEDSDLARACDRAAVELKILLACWDGLEPDEEKLLGEQEAALLDRQEVQALVADQLAQVREGAPVEDRLLESLGRTMDRVSASLRAEVGRALLVDALPVVFADRILSGQEREVVMQELAPVLGIEAAVAQNLLDQRAAQLAGS